MGSPPESARTQMLAVYVPALVFVTQFGSSFSWHFRRSVEPFCRTAAPALPPRPGDTRDKVTPLPDPSTLHPDVLTSKPGLPMRFPDGGGEPESETATTNTAYLSGSPLAREPASLTK